MRNAAFELALGKAADLLGASAFPVVAGLQADLAGIAAAIRLARKLRGALDHAGSEALLADLAVLHDAGMMLVSPGEARRRADTVLLVGHGPLQAWPDLVEFLSTEGSQRRTGAVVPRRFIRLTDDGILGLDSGAGAPIVASCGLAGLLGALRARVHGRPVAAGLDVAGLDRVAALIKATAYGVAVWSPGEIDALAIEMLVGLIKDLNVETRWAGLSVAADLSGVLAGMAAGWMTGLPLRSGFGRGIAEHDPWRFEARRLVRSGEADAVVWVSACGEPPPDWIASVPAVVLADVELATEPDRISLSIGRPGLDHDAVLFDQRNGSLVQLAATRPSSLPSAAEALNRIAAGLPAC